MIRVFLLTTVLLVSSSCENSSPSGPVTIPNPPTGLVASPVSWRAISLSWEDRSNNEVYFVLERKLEGDTLPWQDVAHVPKNLTAYTDTSLVAQVSYDYRIAAFNSAGMSEYATATVCTTREAGLIEWHGGFAGRQNEAIFTGMTATSDGGYAVVGYDPYDPYAHSLDSAYVIKYDGTGGKLWYKSFRGSEESDIFQDICELSDGGFAAIGQSDLDYPLKEGGLIVKISSDGEEVWRREFGGETTYDKFTCVAPTADGGMVAGGTRYNNQNYHSRGWLMKLDGTGRKIWEKHYDNVYDSWIIDILALDDGGFLICGGSMIRLDSRGNQVWRVEYTATRPGAILTGLDQCHDGGFIASGWFLGEGAADLDQSYAVRVTPTGVKVWEKYYDAVGQDDFSGVAALSDGGFAFVGGADPVLPNIGNQDARIVRIDKDGNMLWQKIWGTGHPDQWSNEAEYLTDVIATPDGGFVACGGMWSGWIGKFGR